MQLSDLLTKIANDLAPAGSGEIAPDTELLMSGLIDSLGVMNLVSWIEQQIDTQIDPGDVVIENFETPTAIMDFVGQS